MPRISEFYGIIIFMYFRDHNPPHFHAKYNEYKILITIQDLRILRGHLPPKAFGMIMEWAATHQDELLENWHSIQEGRGWKTIEPLE